MDIKFKKVLKEDEAQLRSLIENVLGNLERK